MTNISACKQWDVRIHHVSGTTYIPQIYWHDKWTPICGHYFSENRVGARTFCNKLGYFDGSIVQENVKAYDEDAYWIGKCEHSDSFPKCQGGCNENKVGGQCSEWAHWPWKYSRNCDKGQKGAALYIDCVGEHGKTSTCAKQIETKLTL